MKEVDKPAIDWSKVEDRIYRGFVFYAIIGFIELAALFLSFAFDMEKMDRVHDFHQKLAYSRQTMTLSCLEGHLVAYGFVFLVWVSYRVYIRFFKGDWTGLS